jgi:hypothetical protein
VVVAVVHIVRAVGAVIAAVVVVAAHIALDGVGVVGVGIRSVVVGDVGGGIPVAGALLVAVAELFGTVVVPGFLVVDGDVVGFGGDSGSHCGDSVVALAAVVGFVGAEAAS